MTLPNILQTPLPKEKRRSLVPVLSLLKKSQSPYPSKKKVEVAFTEIETLGFVSYKI
jgi:hypothetical protein